VGVTDDPTSTDRAPLLLDRLPTQSPEVILSHVRKASGLTLGILKLLYPRADMDVEGEGFATTCTEDEAHKQVEDSAAVVSQVMEMIPINRTQV
jgi:hypothetical protein